MKRFVLFLLMFACVVGGEVKAEDICTHAWVVVSSSAGTCVREGMETKKCSICGEESVETLPLGDHSYEGAQWVLNTPPTCTSPGINIKACVICGGDPVYQEIPAKGHAWQSSTQEADCTQVGAIRWNCSDCGETRTESIPAKGHSEVTDTGRAATCTEDGISEGKHCAVCGLVTMAQQNIPAKGHNMMTTAGVDPTCTQPGQAEGQSCTTCGYSVEGAIIPAAGHQEQEDGNRKEAACTQTGLTASKSCSVCGMILSGQKTIAAKGHREIVDAARAPTIHESGLTKGVHCGRCGLVLAKQQMIPALKEWPCIATLLEQMNWEVSSDDVGVQWLDAGDILEVSLAKADAEIRFGIAAKNDQNPIAFYLATAFSQTPSPDWETILKREKQESFFRVLASDAHYGPFLQEAQELMMAVISQQTAEEREMILTELFRNATTKETDLDMRFGSFLRAEPMNEHIIDKNGCEYALISDGVNLILMIRYLD